MLTTRQRLVLLIPIVFVVAAGVILWLNNTEGTPTADDRIIESLTPADKSKVLQQSEVAIDLQSGWDASLTINGRLIPDDQLSKVLPQGRVGFLPGPGKELEYLQAGPNCATATYWPLSNPQQKFSKTWCFTAT